MTAVRGLSPAATHPRSLLLFCAFWLGTTMPVTGQQVPVQEAAVRKIDGYRGIWFTLGQFSEYGDKYSGGLGTYTAKHAPLAVYAPEVHKTFFVYGGTTGPDQRHLLAMISWFDHNTGLVPRPTVVRDKGGVDDPHDNPSLCIDGRGHLWVFVSGRARTRLGFLYRSRRPYDIEGFDLVLEGEFAYPQPRWTGNTGFFWFFTRYTNGRELYWATSRNGQEWSDAAKLASGGHYQVSAVGPGLVGTAFNVHIPPGNVDTRTNLYYLESRDQGKTWLNAAGKRLSVPLEGLGNGALIRDYRSRKRLVYMKDMGFDSQGHPVVLHVTSGDYRPGPAGMPRTWTVARWDGSSWLFSEITSARHNYDMGSLYLESESLWRLIAPTDAGPYRWGAGGEMALWISKDSGASWTKARVLTGGSERNHGYARRPVNAHPDFYAFWADGNPDRMSISRLYFCSRDGDVRQLPYDMSGAFEAPVALAQK